MIDMENDIGRCISREEALKTLNFTKQFIPNKYLMLYVAALNRTKYELSRHDPVKPVNGCCGRCGLPIDDDRTYCSNCGREIDKS